MFLCVQSRYSKPPKALTPAQAAALGKLLLSPLFFVLFVVVPTHTHTHTNSSSLPRYFYCFNPCLGGKLQKCLKQESVSVETPALVFHLWPCSLGREASEVSEAQGMVPLLTLLPWLSASLSASCWGCHSECSKRLQAAQSKAEQGAGSSGEVWAGEPAG